MRLLPRGITVFLGCAFCLAAPLGASGATKNKGAAVEPASVTVLAPCYGGDSEISPCDGSMNLTPGSSQYVYFTLSNYTWYDDYWEVMPSCDGAAVTSCGPSYASVLVPAMSSVSYGVLTTTSSTPGTGWLAIQAYTGGTSASLFSSLTVSVSNPGASPLTLDVSYSNNSYQSPVLCAAACFAVTHAQSTVPFFSFDSPNSVTLVYNGDRAYPRPFVYGDVIFGPTSPAVSEYWLDVQVNGAPASFVNGNSGRIYFQGSSSSVRLGGQIDATGMATGVYPMTITVTAVRAGGNEVLSRQTELMVANESGSAVAAGWSIAGVQRLYFPAVGGYMIAEGDGTAVRLTGLGAYATDFSYLTFDGTYYTRNYSDGVRAVFNQSGLHVYTTDRTGRRISFAYSGSQLVTVEGSARYLGMAAPYHSLAYGGSGLASITEVSQGGPNRVTSITVDGSRKLTRITDPDAYYTQFGYDGYGRLSAATDRRGGTTEYVYHASWKLNQVILPQIPMDAGGGGTTPANPIASFWPWQREGVPTGYTSTSNPAQPAGLYGIQAVIQDPEGHLTSFSVNAFGQPRTTTDPAGRSTTVSYDGTRPLSVTRPDGATDSFQWNGAFLSWAKSAGEAERSFGYGVFGQIQQIWGPGTRQEYRYLNSVNGNVDSIRYEASAQPVQIVRYFYDGTTQALRRVVDAQAHETSLEYDAQFGNVRRTVAPGNRIVDATFDSYGRTSAVTPSGRPQQTIQYDVVNRATHVYDGVNGQPVTLGYDALFQTSVTDQKSQVYAAEYNALGWPTRHIDPLGAATTIRYDRRGLTKSTTNRRSQRVDMTYDNVGRILSKTGANTTSDYFEYSPDNRITVAWNQFARDSVFYDPFSGSDSTVTRLQSPSGEQRFRIYHSNNPDYATPDTMNVTSSTGVNFPQRYYTWDATTGALSSFAFAGQYGLSMDYNTEQLRTGTSFPNSSGTRTESYTSLHGVIQSQFSNSNLHTNFYRGYEYDDIGRVKRVLTAQSGGLRWTYSYDNLGRLTGRDTHELCVINSESPDFGLSTGCGFTGPSEVFSYDQVGNRTDLGGVAGTGNRIQSFNGISFAHDADGNVTQKYKGGSYNRQYWWSAEARLDSAQQDSWSKVKYDYDAQGRPVRKWRGDPVNGWIFDQLWIYDGDHRLFSLDANLQRIEEYAYAPGIDRPIATIRGATGVEAVGYHVQDELGNILGIIENGAYVSQTNSYDAWGTPSETGIAYNNQLKWKGLKWEGDVISLYYMRNRWYDYETGRFMSEDPIGLAGGINLYSFANNDPINGRDPYGLESCYYVVTWKYYKDDPLRMPIPGTTEYHGPYGDCGGQDPGEGGGGGTPTQEKPKPPRNRSCATAPGVVGPNIRAAQGQRVNPFGIVWFHNRVRTDGLWDFKRGGKFPQYEAFGNFHYGATGAAAGIPSQILLRAAGRNHMQGPAARGDFGHYLKGPPYGDDPRDQLMIRLGIQYYQSGCPSR